LFDGIPIGKNIDEGIK